jgi:hypothetical protein
VRKDGFRAFVVSVGVTAIGAEAAIVAAQYLLSAIWTDRPKADCPESAIRGRLNMATHRS